MNTENLILNVDDDEAGRYAKSRILKRAGYEVVEAGTGADALRLVSESTPQLVLLDVKLPDISGMDVCRKIKEDPASSHIMVLQISASHITTPDRVLGLGVRRGYLFDGTGGKYGAVGDGASAVAALQTRGREPAFTCPIARG